MALALGYAETLNRAAATLAPFYRKLKRFVKQIPARRRSVESQADSHPLPNCRTTATPNFAGGDSDRLGERAMSRAEVNAPISRLPKPAAE
jgi:hypothetical protein